MLLYQMSQWLSEHQRLKRELWTTEPETVHQLHNQIQELEQRLYSRAHQWLASYETPVAAVSLGHIHEPPVLEYSEPNSL